MKILVCGDIHGNFKTLFTRVEGVLKKTGGFDMMFCVGSFFADTDTCIDEWKSIKDGTLKVPVPMFILGPTSTDCQTFFDGITSDGGELTDNITCLGQRGVYTTSSGLQIAYLSGYYDKSKYMTSNDNNEIRSHFTQEDMKCLSQYSDNDDFQGVDMLLSSEWPQGVTNHAISPEGLDTKNYGSSSVSRLAARLRPRYHFSAKMELFYERTPYRNHEVLSSEQKHVTRFIALANVDNPDKKKRYLYAFSIDPMKHMDHKELTQQPQAITDSPYKDILEQECMQGSICEEGQWCGNSQSCGTLSDTSSECPEPKAGMVSSESGDQVQQNFFFDAKAIAAGKKRQQREREKMERHFDSSGPPTKRRPPPQPKGPCWFCLGSAEVEKHLIVSIGDNAYTALPKGGLVNEHVLILPIGHYPSSVEAPKEVLDEVTHFKQALRQYFKTRKQSCVMFERNYRSQHLQIQVVPVPLCESGALRQAFIDHGKQQKLEFSEISSDVDITQVIPAGAAYFVVEFNDGPSLFVRIKGFFSLQFGREVLASPLILNTPNRINWKSCALSKEEEIKLTEKFRNNFKPFDFTIDDDDD